MLDQLLIAVEGSDLATALRFSRWGYAAVNTTHVLGIALLVGSIIPLDLRLMGFWNTVPREPLIRVLVPIAAFGLAMAIAAGLLLFSVRAVEYAALAVFQLKLLLILIGTSSAAVIHITHGRWLRTSNESCFAKALLSMTCWLGTLIAGRMIAFASD